MQFTRKLFVLVAALILVASSVFAQYPPCHIPPGVYCTRTQGGWGAECNGGNAGCILQNNFATVFPAGLTIGGTFTIHFSSNIAVRDFLPAGETPGVLTANHTDPASTEAGVFAGQLTALAINVAMGDAGVAGFTDIGHLIIPQGIDFPAGPFAGYSVDQILALANQVLGGDLGALPAGISVSELSSVLNAINNNFDNCTDSDEYLVEPGCDEILPVAMGTFYAEPSADGIRLVWRTLSEQNVDRYVIERSAFQSSWEVVAAVESHGSSPTGYAYASLDQSVSPGVEYSYRLAIYELGGEFSYYDVVAHATASGTAIPQEFALQQNFPNPFNPSTTISFDVPEATHVNLTVYDLNGREVATLVNRNLDASSYTILFDAAGLPGGTYFYRIDAGSFTAVRKMLLLR